MKCLFSLIIIILSFNSFVSCSVLKHKSRTYVNESIYKSSHDSLYIIDSSTIKHKTINKDILSTHLDDLTIDSIVYPTHAIYGLKRANKWQRKENIKEDDVNQTKKTTLTQVNKDTTHSIIKTKEIKKEKKINNKLIYITIGIVILTLIILFIIRKVKIIR